MFCKLTVGNIRIDIDAECIDVNFYIHWLLTLCVLLEDALHIDFDAVRNSCCGFVHWLLIDATSIDFFCVVQVLSS